MASYEKSYPSVWEFVRKCYPLYEEYIRTLINKDNMEKLKDYILTNYQEELIESFAERIVSKIKEEVSVGSTLNVTIKNISKCILTSGAIHDYAYVDCGIDFEVETKGLKIGYSDSARFSLLDLPIDERIKTIKDTYDNEDLLIIAPYLYTINYTCEFEVFWYWSPRLTPYDILKLVGFDIAVKDQMYFEIKLSPDMKKILVEKVKEKLEKEGYKVENITFL